MTYPYPPENWAQLSSLLDSVLELPEDQRLTWIDGLITESQETKAQLRELLKASVLADQLLVRRPDFSAALLEEAQYVKQIQIELQPGRLVGAYRLLRELGRGGMGSVWLAQRVDGKFKRDDALKFPYAGPHQRQLIERLVRERDILASLQHANIARLYDADVTASGQPFLVLEYIDGVAINTYCDQHRLDIRERLILFKQVLNAMRYAHTHLVIHRDLKPSNILITDDGVVHLLDFGIATFIANGTAHATPLTQLEGHMLTPEYASPEQAAKATLTTVSDIYSLGVVLYQLLTGTLPYQWHREQRSQLEQAIINANVIPPSRATITDEMAVSRNTRREPLLKMLRGDLDTLILKALKKEPEQRYASADAFAEDIARYLEGKPILAQPDSEWYRVKKFMQRNRGTVASLASIIIALLVGIVTTSWQAHVAKQQRDRAVALAARDEAVTDFLQLVVTDVASANEPITMQKLLSLSENIANRTYLSDINQQAAILEVLGNYYLSFNEADKANQAFAKALVIEEKKTDQILRAKLLCLSATALFQLGNIKLAQQRMESGISLSDKAPDVQAMCFEGRASIKYLTSDLDGTLADLRTAQEKLALSGVNKPNLAVNLLMDMATAYAMLGHSRDADVLYSQAARLLNDLGRGETISAMMLQDSWGEERANGGDPLGALKHFDSALELAHKHGETMDQDSQYAANRAFALHQLGRDEDAVPIFNRVIGRAKANGAIIGEISAMQGLAFSLLSLRQIPEAEKIMNEVVRMVDKDVPNHGPAIQNILVYRANLAMEQKRYQDAIHICSKLIDASITHNTRGSFLSLELMQRGTAYLAEKNFEAALIDGKAAWEDSQAAPDKLPYSNASGRAALLLAQIHYEKNEKKEADRWANIAFEQLQGSLGANHPRTIEATQLLHNLQSGR